MKMLARNSRSDEAPFGYWSSGQILVLTALSIVALIGMLGLAIDVGNLWSTKRAMQTAADAAAVAAANALQGSSTVASAYATSAQDVAKLNGFQNSTNGVTVSTSEVSCPGASSEQCVEVNITQAVPTYFLSVLGFGNTTNVSTQAIAGGVNSTGCIYALDPSKSEAIYLDGNISINASCGMIDDSTSSTGLYATGNGTITTTETGVSGNYNSSSLGNISFSPSVITGIAPVPDPLASLAAPSVGTCTQLSQTSSSSYTVSGNNSTVTVPAGIYKGGVSLGGNSNTVTFSSANYGNGINVDGNTGSATFGVGQYQSDFSTHGGPSSCSGNSFDSSNDASVCINGNANTSFTAGTYTFCGPVEIIGNNTVTLSPGLYYGGISITGNANVTFNPGTYILDGGGLSVTGNSTLSGSGVTFYLTSGLGGYGPVDITGNATITLSAPTSGSLKGILFFQDRTIASGSAASTIIGNSSSYFNGVVYFPTTALTWDGNSGSSGYTDLIADSISITGNASLTIGSNYSSLGGVDPLSSNTLYE